MNKTGKTKGKRHDPASSVIAKMGGVRSLARSLFLDPSTLSKWQRRGGLIPSRWHRPILNLARERSVELTERDLIPRR